MLDEDDLQKALYHATILHNAETSRAVPYIDALANSIADRHVFVYDPSSTLLANHVDWFCVRFREVR